MNAPTIYFVTEEVSRYLASLCRCSGEPLFNLYKYKYMTAPTDSVKRATLFLVLKNCIIMN